MALSRQHLHTKRSKHRQSGDNRKAETQKSETISEIWRNMSKVWIYNLKSLSVCALLIRGIDKRD